MRTITILLATICLLSASAFAKYEKTLDIKVNPEVDFSNLEFSTVTIYAFDLQALCGDDVVKLLHDNLAKILSEHGIASIQMSLENQEETQDDFSLEATGSKEKKTLFKASENDLVFSGSFIKAESITKRWGKRYLDLQIEIYIYSKSLDTVVYKGYFSNMIRFGGGYGAKLHESLIELLEPLFEKLEAPEKEQPVKQH